MQRNDGGCYCRSLPVEWRRRLRWLYKLSCNSMLSRPTDREPTAAALHAHRYIFSVLVPMPCLGKQPRFGATVLGKTKFEREIGINIFARVYCLISAVHTYRSPASQVRGQLCDAKRLCSIFVRGISRESSIQQSSGLSMSRGEKLMGEKASRQGIF